VGMLQTTDRNRSQASSEAGNDYETKGADESIWYVYIKSSFATLLPRLIIGLTHNRKGASKAKPDPCPR